jgi:hypothetical protein
MDGNLYKRKIFLNKVEMSRILSPSYCYPENWKLEFSKKIAACGKMQQREPV